MRLSMMRKVGKQDASLAGCSIAHLAFDVVVDIMMRLYSADCTLFHLVEVGSYHRLEEELISCHAVHSFSRIFFVSGESIRGRWTHA